MPSPRFWPFGLVFVETLVATFCQTPFTWARRYA